MTLSRSFPRRFQCQSRSRNAQCADSTSAYGAVPGCRGLLRAIAFAVASLLTVSSVVAQDAKPGEYQVKAAYLSNLGRFVETWGSRSKPLADESFNVCVLGHDPFGPGLDAAVNGESIGGAPAVAKRISKPPEASGCQVLFISASEDGQLSVILAALGTAPVLTVADIPDFVKRGGMIQFVLDGNRVRFEINLAASSRAGLSLSSELLKLARLVRRTP